MHDDTETSEKGLTPTGLVWDTNMATSLFFGGTIMVDVTTSEYALCQALILLRKIFVSSIHSQSN